MAAMGNQKLSPEENKKFMDSAWRSALSEAQKILKKQGVTPYKVAKRLFQSLDATEVVAKFDGGPVGSGKWVYSKKLVAYGVRLQAVKLAAQLLDMEPAEKIDLSLNETLAQRIQQARERRKHGTGSGKN